MLSASLECSLTCKKFDLYPPLKRFLTQQGYEVKGEVQHCDVIAVRGDEPVVVIELKLSINMTVVLQAVDRLQISDTVYIGVPKDIAVLKKTTQTDHQALAYARSRPDGYRPSRSAR